MVQSTSCSYFPVYFCSCFFYFVPILFYYFTLLLELLIFYSILFPFWTYCMCASIMSDSLWPQGLCSPPGSTVMGFSRQEYWNRLSCHPTVDLLVLLFCYFRSIFRGTHICTYIYAIYTREIICIYIHIYGKHVYKIYTIIMDTCILGLLCFILLHFTDVFFKLKVCGEQCYWHHFSNNILVILTISQPFIFIVVVMMTCDKWYLTLLFQKDYSLLQAQMVVSIFRSKVLFNYGTYIAFLRHNAITHLVVVVVV